MVLNKFVYCVLLLVILLGSSFSVADSLDLVSTDYDLNIKSLVRVYIDEEIPLFDRDVEIVGFKQNEYIEAVIAHKDFKALTLKERDYKVIIPDMDEYIKQTAGEYHTLAEIEQILQDFADNYPGITSLYSIGETWEGRQIWCLEISDNPGVDEDEPGVLYIGLHHAREWPSVENCIYLIDQLTSLYTVDSEITDLVDNRRIWVVTCLNPDGYHYCHDEGNDWRKNRHYFSEFGTYGVDLNRNYGGSSNGNIWGAWGSVGLGGATHNPEYSTYCGPEPFSEAETQAIRDLIVDNDICAGITWHTYGELVLWPWGYRGIDHVPDDDYISEVGENMASLISTMSEDDTYYPTQGSGLYPTTGDTMDWTYGYGHYVLGKTPFIYTVESCDSFHPPASEIDQVVAENFDGALYLLKEAGNISTLVESRVLPPIIDAETPDVNGDYSVFWEEINPEAQVEYFQLDELSDLWIKTDNAESGFDLWNEEGFTESNIRFHSGSFSFKSRLRNKDVCAITSSYPVPVSENMKLSFWCWYDIEEDWDYGFVEVSRDGRYYDVLDSFTGSSSGWEFKEYSLDDYVDESVFIRFRYTADEQVTNEGFYVDDIFPVADFESETVISDSIEENHYNFTEQPNGSYYYRVKGYNDAYEWCDHSTLKKVQIGKEEPVYVEITAPEEKRLYFLNKNILPFFTTVVIGKIDVYASVSDPSRIGFVEFYLDDELQNTSTSTPYSWLWDVPSFSKHTIQVVAYDKTGNTTSDEISVWKIF